MHKDQECTELHCIKHIDGTAPYKNAVEVDFAQLWAKPLNFGAHLDEEVVGLAAGAQPGRVPAEKHRLIDGIVTVERLGAVQTRDGLA